MILANLMMAMLLASIVVCIVEGAYAVNPEVPIFPIYFKHILKFIYKKLPKFDASGT